MSERETFLRVKVGSLYPQYTGVSGISGARTLWVTCPLCGCAVKLTPVGLVGCPGRWCSATGRCAVRFDPETSECLIPLEDIPRAVACKLRGAGRV